MNSFIRPERVFFRVDFGGLIGWGHLSRCLAVASTLAEKGKRPVFIIRKRPSALGNIPFPVIWLPETLDVSSQDVSTWRLGSESDEAKQILEHLPEKSSLILDHYALGLKWQKILRENGHHLIIFQDKVDPQVSADILINYHIHAPSLYSSKEFQGIKLLLGPSFAPLKTVFQNYHEIKVSHEVKLIGLYLGGETLESIRKIATALKNLDFCRNIHLEWVVNSQEEEAAIDSIFQGIKIHIRMPDLLELYKRSDLFIGALGVAFLERACMGMWQMNFVTADNQTEIAEYIEKENLGVVLGDLRLMTSEEIIDAVTRAWKLPLEKKESMITSVFQKVDGHGAHAISEALVG
jgi:UDP-2,4-diacetamido-2,4,6-trideoxy-beta-L-altropyranose hydrolase